jgi:hypothetical protein
MDDYRVCSDLCEEQGFLWQAQLMRAFAASGGKAYVVVKRAWERYEDITVLKDGGSPQVVLLSRDEAEREAEDRTVRLFRDLKAPLELFCSPDEVVSRTERLENLGRWIRGWNTGRVFSLDEAVGMSEPELNRRVGQILGRPFEGVFAQPNRREKLFPADEVSDEQLRHIVRLFKNARLFYVVETPFAG